MSKLTFEEKVRAMSAYEIVMAMVEGLKNPLTKIDMTTFGWVDNQGTCFGCAATNAISKIAGVNEFVKTSRMKEGWSHVAVNSEPDFLDMFETAIDDLRSGDSRAYNDIAADQGFALIVNEEKLPPLESYNYIHNLAAYEALALRQVGAPTQSNDTEDLS